MEAPFPFLQEETIRLVLFGGKGGVGKTTCASATALSLARSFPGASFLLISTDPAHSTFDSLGTGFVPPVNLQVEELDAATCLAAFKEKHGETLREIAVRGTFLDQEDIRQLLELSLPGMDELMAFLEISARAKTGKYRCMIVDTAPTGHTLELLGMPGLIRKWLKALDALVAKHRYMKRLFGRSTRQDETDRFLRDLSGSVASLQSLMQDALRCRFVPVMIGERICVLETEKLLRRLQELRIPVTDIVLNKFFSKSPCEICSVARARQLEVLSSFSGDLSGCRLWGVPLYAGEVVGQEMLHGFWSQVRALDVLEEKPKPLGHFPHKPLQRVECPAELCSSEKKLILFAGKGGVGKTTLACATAVRMARKPGGKEIFLFSTDPAHSLSSCLEVAIGSSPTGVFPGLSAMEIDAPQEFETLKRSYRSELEAFFDNISQNLDFTFDREVMERIMDLSPPGLDEVMALTRVMELMAKGAYDLFILDSAPTGHLIRLLEMPRLIDQWLKLIFNLFLKYQMAPRMPGISRRLVQMSRDLKRFKAVLTDPDASILYAVAIPADMAFLETMDLMDSCLKMGVNAGGLFLNLATPVSDCPLCSRIARNESQMRKKFQENFPMHQALVYRQGDIRGLGELEELGNAMYR